MAYVMLVLAVNFEVFRFPCFSWIFHPTSLIFILIFWRKICWEWGVCLVLWIPGWPIYHDFPLSSNLDHGKKMANMYSKQCSFLAWKYHRSSSVVVYGLDSCLSAAYNIFCCWTSVRYARTVNVKMFLNWRILQHLALMTLSPLMVLVSA